MNTKWNRVALACMSITVLAGCATLQPGQRVDAVERSIDEEIVRVRQQTQVIATQQAQTSIALKEAYREQQLAQLRSEPRFDLLLTNAPVKEVYLSLVAGTTWSLMLHPDIKGTISTTLRRVTLRETLDALRDMYGYDYRIEGSRISVFAPTPQTRSFVVNYLTSQRVGKSDLRVNSGSAAVSSASVSNNNTIGSNTNSGAVSTQVQTSSNADLWKEIGDAIRAMVQPGEGKHVLFTPQASLITVRAMPEELRQIEQYLNTVRGAVQRQVMLEAKIIDVELSENFQSGVQWNRLFSPGNTLLNIGTLNQNNDTTPSLPANGVNIPGLISLPALNSGAFGLSLAASNFNMVLSFLESFGRAKVLSSPRVATMNNQRALLKVGTDEFFITSATPGATVSAGTGSPTVNPPTLHWASFFSGISLDVTPQIDDTYTVTMHIRPSVSSVRERTRELDLGTAGNYRLPTATSSVNETDTVVRIPDGHIVAIGGLMQMESEDGSSGLPGAENAGAFKPLFANNRKTARKRELVILIKPTVIRQAQDWASTWDKASLLMQIEPTKVIRIEGVTK